MALLGLLCDSNFKSWFVCHNCALIAERTVANWGPDIADLRWLKLLSRCCAVRSVNPVEAVVPGASVYSVEAVVQLLVSGCEALLGGCAELEVDDTAPNHEFPFVRDGGGAPRGLTPVEHFAWAAGQKAQHKERFLSPDLIKAVRYEVRHTAEQIDSHRQEVVDLWRAKAAELAGENRVRKCGGH